MRIAIRQYGKTIMVANTTSASELVDKDLAAAAELADQDSRVEQGYYDVALVRDSLADDPREDIDAAIAIK